MQNAKQYKVELDMYERRYVTVNGLDIITYSDEYIKGYTGNILSATDAEISRPVFGHIGNIISPVTYKDKCVDYIKRLLILLDRVKGLFTLHTPVNFDKSDVVKLYWKIINDTVLFSDFIRNYPKIAKILREKIIEFKNEIQNMPEKKHISLQNIECLLSKSYVFSMR